MKKVIRLNEADLVRLVKRVLSEQPMQGSGAQVWSMLQDAIEGLGTDEKQVQRACAMVTTPEIYKQVLSLANKKGHKTVMDYIMTDFSTWGVDQPVQTSRSFNVGKDWDKEGYSKDIDTQVTKFCASNLSKFNRSEMGSFGSGVRIDRPA